MPATTVSALIYRIIWDDGDARKKADAWNRKLNDAKKYAKNAKFSFEDLAREIGAFKSVLLVSVAALDKGLQGIKKFARYIKDFANPAIAGYRLGLLGIKVAMGVFNAAIAVGKAALKAFVVAIKGVIDAGKRIFEFIVDSVKNFAQFEDTLSHARRTMGLSREETLELGNALMDLSTSFEEGGLAAGVSANELAKISGILGQLGFNTRDNQAQFESLVAVVAKVGVAFGMTSQKAAEGLGILKNLYDLPVEKIENAASSIAYLGNTTVATASQIMDIMQRMGGIAGLLGVTAQEAAALAATLREAGVRAGLAGTSMSQIFSRMASDVERFGEVLKMTEFEKSLFRMNIESGKATDALKMVLTALQKINTQEGKIAATQALKDLGLSGVRVQQTLLALSNNIAGLNKNLSMSNKAFRENKAVNDAYQSAIDNTSKKWTQFKNIIDVIKKLIGQDLALAFSDFLENHLIPFADHFKTWLKTSEGAKAIFGKEGLIATGLTWIGEKLSESEEDFFSWMDNIDEHVPAVIEAIKQKFREFWEEHKITTEDLEKTWEAFKKILSDVSKAIDFVKEKWSALTSTVKEFMDSGIGKLLMETIPLATYKSSQGLYDFVKAAKEGTKAGQEMGKEWVYQSVLPDIQVELDKATAKLEKFGGSTKDLYKTGENTWTNLKREVDDTMTVWELQDGYAMKRQADLQFNLYETADKVTSLGYAYQKTGQDAEKAAQAMEKTVEVAQQLQAMAGAALPVQRGSTTMTGQTWQDMSAAQVRDLWSTSNVFSASGLTAAQESQRAKAGQERQAAIQSQQQPITVVLEMDKQEVGRVNAILEDHKQQDGRRSFSGASRR